MPMSAATWNQPENWMIVVGATRPISRLFTKVPAVKPPTTLVAARARRYELRDGAPEPVLTLDGSLSAKERTKRVAAFQAGEADEDRGDDDGKRKAADRLTG